MLHNNTAQQQAREQPSASAPKASQEPSWAQSAAKFKIPIFGQADHCHENGVTTGLRAGDMDTKPIHIYNKHSPPPRPTTHNIATHATMQRPLHQDGLMAGPLLAHMHQQKPARHHSLGDGHVQALSVFGAWYMATTTARGPTAVITFFDTEPASQFHCPATPRTTHAPWGRTRGDRFGPNTGTMHGATTAPRSSHRCGDPSQYEPCHNAMATALGWAYGKPTACAHVPTAACTKPSSRGWTRAGPLGFRT